MSRSTEQRAAVVIGVLATAFSLMSCSTESDPLFVANDLLSAEVQAQLTKKLGEQSPPITCDYVLRAEIGSTTTCLMNAPKGIYNVTVTVTDLDWSGFGNFGVGNAIFDTKVADQPNP